MRITNHHYLPLTPNSQEFTHLQVTVYLFDGGRSMRDGSIQPRRYALSVTPCIVEKKDGYSTVQSTPMQYGVNCTLMECTRNTPKNRAKAKALAQENLIPCIQSVLSQIGENTTVVGNVNYEIGLAA